jgi:hypothetical protein
MPSFNFQLRFAPKIASGKKGGTIRSTQRCKPGQFMFLFTGLRTKQCNRIGTKPCKGVVPVTLVNNHIYLDGLQLSIDEANEFAKADGFKDLDAFYDFFKDQYGLPYTGFWHVWSKSLLEKFMSIKAIY